MLQYDSENQYHYNDTHIFFTKSFLSQWYGGFGGQNSWFTLPLFGSIMIKFNCAEQAMMWTKAMLFEDYGTAEQIMRQTHPSIQKKLGRQVVGFRDDDWDRVKLDIVTSITRHKFRQNKHLSTKLLATGDKILVEAAPWDKVWGIGMGVEDVGVEDEKNWKGENLLGKAIMTVREDLFELYKTITF